MKQMTLLLTLLLALLLTLPLAGCGGGVPTPDDQNRLTVVSTTFVGYDFTREMLTTAPGGEMENILLGKAGQDMHDYEPSAADILTLARADVVVCLGASAEPWLEAALRAAGNENVRRVEMMAVCDTLSHAPTEGMDTADAHDHEHAEGESCGLIGTDEHVWLSPSNAILIAEAMGQAFAEIGGELWGAPQKTFQLSACAEYTAKLTALRDAYTAMMETATKTSVVIADRYPFAYLFRELGVTAYAAFPGCSSETSASFATQTFLIEKTKELALPYIFTIEGSDAKVAEVVAAESGAAVLTLHSLQVVSDRELTYIDIMRTNLENLKKALS